MPPFRIEKDPLGELRVPAAAYYGVQTQRAVENFPISGMTAPPELVNATVQIKKAAAEANRLEGRLAATPPMLDDPKPDAPRLNVKVESVPETPTT